MKVSYNWLDQYLDLRANKVDPHELANKIVLQSVDLNGTYSPADGLKKLVVGYVADVQPHPNSDHLHICQVQVGADQTVQIVCGAPNVVAGKKVIVALHGARIADNVKIKRGKIRGEESDGMLCALQEIGFSDKVAPKDYDEGIWFLPDDAKVGEPVYSYLGMDDFIIDTDLTPNRGDMLSIYGNVNDVAAILHLKKHFTTHDCSEDLDQQTSDLVNVKIDDSKMVPAYEMRVIKDVKVADSPLWMQIKLWNAGVRPVNNVVDVTNYIMLKYGQPLHSFDYDKLPSTDISVQHPADGAKFTTLDGEERELKASDIMVMAGQTPIALAGTMGGQETAVDDHTTTVALESAIFDPVMVRKQAHRLNLHSEASMRFERGVNPETVQTALNEAAYWLQQLAGGKVASGVVVGQQPDVSTTPVTISIKKTNEVLGLQLTMDEVVAIMERLDFAVTQLSDDQLKVDVPARRWDISIPADLYEEIARLYGYEKIPATLPTMTRTSGGLTKKQRFEAASRLVMQACGLNQAISYSLTTKERATQFTIEQPVDPLMLDYPMSTDHVAGRESIVSGLLNDVAYNTARKVANVALYETGRVFIPAGKPQPREETHLAGVLCGQLRADNWHDKNKAVDFFTMKGIVAQYLKNAALAGKVTYVANHHRDGMHPGRTADIYLDDQRIGYVGQVHPTAAAQYKIPETFVFELNEDLIFAAKKRDRHYRVISRYPSITRDIALLLPNDVTNQQVVDVINQKGGAFLRQVHLFDVYEGLHLPKGMRSLAYTLTFLDNDGTLKEDQVNQAMAKVEKALTTQFNAKVR
ncbi:phenylalanine--tRNA ligase subunit beta [uncultured Limosilactobacillus sp.]|uniref:phenylalanine--tRNA ligase subunit beta n=1 Tax=uncultured Limosilactobacillus sp. TaxID=2837629 RepID=UPI0025EB8E57|nr:phenylalanine--tRNA ligase subunit beta [uncultured Limosilactobacillus sp.]